MYAQFGKMKNSLAPKIFRQINYSFSNFFSRSCFHEIFSKNEIVRVKHNVVMMEIYSRSHNLIFGKNFVKTTSTKEITK